MPGKREEDFKRNTSIYAFYSKITSPWGGVGDWILHFLVSLHYRCNIPNLVKIGQVYLEKKMLMHGGQRTMDDGRRRKPTHRSPEWLRWPTKCLKDTNKNKGIGKLPNWQKKEPLTSLNTENCLYDISSQLNNSHMWVTSLRYFILTCLRLFLHVPKRLIRFKGSYKLSNWKVCCI